MFFIDVQLAQHPRLVLDTIHPGVLLKRVFERVCDQSTNIPPRKKVKRESSKALDDSAERAAEEKMMLLGDLKHDKDFQPRSLIPLCRLQQIPNPGAQRRMEEENGGSRESKSCKWHPEGFPGHAQYQHCPRQESKSHDRFHTGSAICQYSSHSSSEPSLSTPERNCPGKPARSPARSPA